MTAGAWTILSGFADDKAEVVGLLFLKDESVTLRLDEMGDVDLRHRIGANDFDCFTTIDFCQQAGGFERRQRAFQSFEV